MIDRPKSKGRGGKRVGAGRKQLLDIEERLAVVLAYRAAMRACAVRNAAERFHRERANGYPDLLALWRDAQTVPVSERRAFLAADDGQHLHDVDAEISEISDRFGKGRFASVSLRVPQGARKSIIAAIARDMSDRTGAPISSEYIAKCLKDKHARGMADELNASQERDV